MFTPKEIDDLAAMLRRPNVTASITTPWGQLHVTATPDDPGLRVCGLPIVRLQYRHRVTGDAYPPMEQRLDFLRVHAYLSPDGDVGEVMAGLVRRCAEQVRRFIAALPDAERVTGTVGEAQDAPHRRPTVQDAMVQP